MWRCYLINLEENRERLERSAREFEKAGLGFVKVDAVNGWRLADEEIERAYDADKAAWHSKQAMVRPEIGCYLSHIKAWQMVAASGEAGGFIFEDDFCAATDLKPILAALSDNEAPWDIVKLFALKRHRMLSRARLTDSHELAFPTRVPTCLLGYAIRAETAARLARLSAPFFRPVDEDHKFWWEKNLRIAMVWPSPLRVGNQQSNTGTVGAARRVSSSNRPSSQIARALRGAFYQLRYNCALLYHRYVG